MLPRACNPVTDIQANSLNKNEQAELQSRMERKQIKEFMTVRVQRYHLSYRQRTDPWICTDVFKTRAELLRFLRQRLYQQNATYKRRKLCDALCRQAPKSYGTSGLEVSRTERCPDAGRSIAGTIELSPRAHLFHE